MRPRLSSLFRGGNEANAVVETALVMPFLCMMLIGIFIFGIAINNQLQLTNSAQAASMQLAISRGDTSITDQCALVSSTVIGSAPALTTSNISITMTTNSGAYSQTFVAGSSEATCTSAPALVESDTLTVKATYPCNLTIYGVNFAPDGCTLSSQSQGYIQ